MEHTLGALLTAGGMFVGMFLMLELGRRFGIARLSRDPDAVVQSGGPVEAVVFALAGLLVAFTFSSAATRFEGRRHLVTDEANAIGTAYLRLDLLPADAQPELRELFRSYVDNRATLFKDTRDLDIVKQRLTDGESLQRKIWLASVAACRRSDAMPQAALLLLPALNEMIDITTTGLMATRNHPPIIVFALLIILSLVSALLVGYVTSRTKAHSWLHMFVFALTMSVTLYVILDLEYPRLGLIRVNDADQVLIDLGKSIR